MKLAPLREREGVEPRPVERRRVRRRPGEELPQSRDDEDRESQILDAEQDVLDALADLDPAPAHPGHQGDEHHTGRRDERDVVGQQRILGRAQDAVDQCPEVDAGDLSEVGEHDHSGDRDPPAAEPAHPRAERLRSPREGRAAVGDLVVELAVREGDEQHRDERDDEHDRRLGADRQHDEPQRRDERVDRRGRGEPDDGGAPQAERAGRQSLAFGSVKGDRGCGHTANVGGQHPPVKHARAG